MASKIKDRIVKLSPQTKEVISQLSDMDLFIWLGEQDNSLRYQLALELDIPLQHLDHTCSTLKQIHHLLSGTS